jgi:hypothetical protein
MININHHKSSFSAMYQKMMFFYETPMKYLHSHAAPAVTTDVSGCVHSVKLCVNTSAIQQIIHAAAWWSW